MTQSRQLAAIMFTDIVGYTALMGDNEKKAFDLLRRNRALQKPLVAEFGGRWIKELGDGVLASFSRVTDAVMCAMRIQQACELVPDLKLRIGIHLGEVVFEDEDVFGDGVNIASRLQALAPIGGIYFSEPVSRNIHNQQGMETEFVKEEMLKNVKHSVKIYQIKKTAAYPGVSDREVGTEEAEKGRKSRAIERSIAVLPFVNMSNDPEQEYFSDGISEEIINSLVQLPGLRVVGRTSAFSFKGKNDDLRSIGEKLGVANILEGSVRKAGTKLRITAQLIEVSNGFHRWSQKFDKELHDIFEVQDEISQAIVDQLMAEFTKLDNAAAPKSPTRDVDAYNLFLQGRFHWSKRTAEGLKKSILFYEEAIARDPGYAAAYAAISDSYSLLCAYHILSPKDSILKAREIAQKAVALDPSLAEGYEAIGHVELLYDWNWSDARRFYDKAIGINPAYATALQRRALISALFGHHQEALNRVTMAVHLEPLSLIINTDVAVIYFIHRDYKTAIEKCLAVLDNDARFGVALFILGLCYEQLGEWEKALDHFDRAWRMSHNHIGLGALGHAYGLSGNRTEAEKCLNELERASELNYISPYTLAQVHLGLGHLEEAMGLVEQAVDTHSVWIIHMHLISDPRMDALRPDSRFQQLLTRMGLQ